MTSVHAGDVTLQLASEQGQFTIIKNDTEWRFRGTKPCNLECREGIFEFEKAADIRRRTVKSGVGRGILSHYEGFEVNGGRVPYAFETLVWVEESSGDVYMEWIPLCEEGLTVLKVNWPGEMEFEEGKSSWYTLLTRQQGIMIPNDWETELSPIGFQGRFGTAGGYMPWFGQVRERKGYIAVCVTPWDAGYSAVHPAGGPYTHVGTYFEPSLGRMDYRRILRYTFLDDCDYNDLCKVYRAYAKERGTLRTLAEKAAKTPLVDRLIGCSFVHTGIKTAVQENSDFFNPAEPEKNNHLTSFEERRRQMVRLHEMGVKKLYLHLDGWAQPGYDNQHPDFTPACREAGGWEGLKKLSGTMQKLGYLFGLHDQYRDYYLAAESYDEAFACRLPDGTVPGHSRWAGGPQTYLCATQAPYYLRRNYLRLKEQGIHVDCAYLDVFTCNEGDECANPHHRMTRRECCEYRNQCFDYLLAQGVLPSSEEVSDWSVPSLVFCHYAPYDFMLKKPGTPKEGIPVPLYNLVYHDCVIEPWMMDNINGQEDYMLYALLNGGAPYLIRDGAYEGWDGSFGKEAGEDDLEKLQQSVKRCRIVSSLHERVAKCEMLRHELADGNPMLQKTYFSDGTTVTVDFAAQTYQITTAGG